jgi:hypothetical protein
MESAEPVEDGDRIKRSGFNIIQVSSNEKLSIYFENALKFVKFYPCRTFRRVPSVHQDHYLRAVPMQLQDYLVHHLVPHRLVMGQVYILMVMILMNRIMM